MLYYYSIEGKCPQQNIMHVFFNITICWISCLYFVVNHTKYRYEGYYRRRENIKHLYIFAYNITYIRFTFIQVIILIIDGTCLTFMYHDDIISMSFCIPVRIKQSLSPYIIHIYFILFMLLYFILFIFVFFSIQGGRVCFTSHSNCEGTGVISLRSAGDISLHQRGPIRRGLIVPQQPPNPPTIIPLTHARYVIKKINCICII